MFVCTGSMESFSFAKPVGIGLIQSAIGLTQLVLEKNPSWLIFIGTAGSYDPDTPLLSIKESVAASQIELSYLENHSYTPLDNVTSLEDVSHETISPLIVNSSNYITTNARLGRRLHEMGISLENMEFYALLEVAKHFHLSAKGIFCITNYTNEKAHESFIAHHQEALQRLESYVRERYAQYL